MPRLRGAGRAGRIGCARRVPSRCGATRGCAAIAGAICRRRRRWGGIIRWRWRVLAVGVALWVGVGFFDSPKPAPARVSAVAQVGAGVADRKARWPAEGPAVLRKAEERLGAGDADGAVAF